MRPIALEFPDDPACTHLERQYMLGDSLLVAPVFRADGEVSYYVPEGRWTRFDGGAGVTGPRWVRESHGFDSVPLLVRPGAVIPVGASHDRPDYPYADGVTLRVYPPLDGSVRVSVPAPTGQEAAAFEVARDGAAVTVHRHGERGPWRVLLVGERGAATVHGGVRIPDDAGLLVDATGSTCSMMLTEWSGEE